MLNRMKKKLLSAVLRKAAVDKKELHALAERLQKLPADSMGSLVLSAVEGKIRSFEAADALKLLFELDKGIYALTGREAIRYGSGVHTKHRHIRYHDFFIEHIPPGSRVLDVGCGKGELAYDIASRVPDVFVFGIDIEESNIKVCREKFLLENMTYVHGDALTDLPDDHFDVIVLSNVLEHIEKRAEFLMALGHKYKPGKILIRVPMFERDWRVPLKKELGLDYRLDETHHIEYTRGEFFDEIKNAGMSVLHHEIAWGEIWAAIKQDHDDPPFRRAAKWRQETL